MSILFVSHGQPFFMRVHTYFEFRVDAHPLASFGSCMTLPFIFKQPEVLTYLCFKLYLYSLPSIKITGRPHQFRLSLLRVLSLCKRCYFLVKNACKVVSFVLASTTFRPRFDHLLYSLCTCFDFPSTSLRSLAVLSSYCDCASFALLGSIRTAYYRACMQRNNFSSN
jgi:hypothetical protein